MQDNKTNVTFLFYLDNSYRNAYMDILEKKNIEIVIHDDQKNLQTSHEDNVQNENSRKMEESVPEVTWNSASTLLLIDIRISLEDKFERPICKKHKLWEEIAQKMREKGYKVSGSMCYDKWRNLTGTYRRNKDKQKQTGQSKINWEFFEIMDKHLCGNKAVNPPSEILMSSLQETPINDSFTNSVPETATTSKTKEITSTIKSTSKKKKRKPDDDDWFKTYVLQRQKERKEREEQRREQLNELISTVKDFTETLKNLVSNK